MATGRASRGFSVRDPARGGIMSGRRRDAQDSVGSERCCEGHSGSSLFVDDPADEEETSGDRSMHGRGVDGHVTVEDGDQEEHKQSCQDNEDGHSQGSGPGRTATGPAGPARENNLESQGSGPGRTETGPEGPAREKNSKSQGTGPGRAATGPEGPARKDQGSGPGRTATCPPGQAREKSKSQGAGPGRAPWRPEADAAAGQAFEGPEEGPAAVLGKVDLLWWKQGKQPTTLEGSFEAGNACQVGEVVSAQVKVTQGFDEGQKTLHKQGAVEGLQMDPREDGEGKHKSQGCTGIKEQGSCTMPVPGGAQVGGLDQCGKSGCEEGEHDWLVAKIVETFDAARTYNWDTDRLEARLKDLRRRQKAWVTWVPPSSSARSSSWAGSEGMRPRFG